MPSPKPLPASRTSTSQHDGEAQLKSTVRRAQAKLCNRALRCARAHRGARRNSARQCAGPRSLRGRCTTPSGRRSRRSSARDTGRGRKRWPWAHLCPRGRTLRKPRSPERILRLPAPRPQSALQGRTRMNRSSRACHASPRTGRSPGATTGRERTCRASQARRTRFPSGKSPLVRCRRRLLQRENRARLCRPRLGQSEAPSPALAALAGLGHAPAEPLALARRRAPQADPAHADRPRTPPRRPRRACHGARRRRARARADAAPGLGRVGGARGEYAAVRAARDHPDAHRRRPRHWPARVYQSPGQLTK